VKLQEEVMTIMKCLFMMLLVLEALFAASYLVPLDRGAVQIGLPWPSRLYAPTPFLSAAEYSPIYVVVASLLEAFLAQAKVWSILLLRQV
jgi:hypothetical protein